MDGASLYTKGVKIWVGDPEKVWIQAEIIQDFDGSQILYKTPDKDGSLKISSPNDFPPLVNPDRLIGAIDVTSLSYLHEASVLYNLDFRFRQLKCIYTYCGILLVATNPYHKMSLLYSREKMNLYHKKSIGELDPHVYAVAEEAFSKMDRESKDQSIIVSGESGSGKTVSAKYTMRYLATVAGSVGQVSSKGKESLEKRVLASSPIMEALGNAKTVRNDNSSRFGKFIEINFNQSMQIIGANVKTYLLEKSRVVFQAPMERNYHVFYQLCAAKNMTEWVELDLKSASKHRYLNQGGCLTIDGVDDLKNFHETTEALTSAGLTGKDQSNMFKVLAAILHLGDVSIISGSKRSENDTCTISHDDPAVKLFSHLLEVPIESLVSCLTTRKIVTAKETYSKPMNVETAMACRDALAKVMYGRLFDWTVKQINLSSKTTSRIFKFIGVLDIYGFETFEDNSFEQFCINYANEKLQQQFNQHVFKLEQQEYIKEGINWKTIDFQDNQPCIDLIEGKLGIFDLLDEECNMPKGSDMSWIHKLMDKCSSNKFFLKPRFNQDSFIVLHFADQVEYTCYGFLEKNRDTVQDEQLDMLRHCQNDLVKEIFNDNPTLVKMKSAGSRGTPQKRDNRNKQTVGLKFRNSLSQLMQTLNCTTPQYIRCINPNDSKIPFGFNAKRVVQQLRACGVIETVRISAAGFPSRLSYTEFSERYLVLSRTSEISSRDVKAMSIDVIKRVFSQNEKFQLGNTKVFLGPGQVAFLERLRSERLRDAAILIQKVFRGWIWKKRYFKLKRDVITVQREVRGFLARQLVLRLRRMRAAVILQKYIKGFLIRKKYKKIKKSVYGLQALGRGMLVRHRHHQKLRSHSATIIQKAFRKWNQRGKFLKTLKQIVLTQQIVRQFLARRKLQKLKKELHSSDQQKDLNRGLEKKIICLAQRISENNKANSNLQKNFEDEIRSMTSREAKLKLEIDGLQQTLKKMETEMNDLHKSKKEALSELEEKTKLLEMSKQDEIRLLGANEALRMTILDLNNNFSAEKEEIISAWQLKFETEVERLTDELEEARMANQCLLEGSQSGNASFWSIETSSESGCFLSSTPRKLSNSTPNLDKSAYDGSQTNNDVSDRCLIARLTRNIGELSDWKAKGEARIKQLEKKLQATTQVLGIFTKKLHHQLVVSNERYDYLIAKFKEDFCKNEDIASWNDGLRQILQLQGERRLHADHLGKMLSTNSFLDQISLLPHDGRFPEEASPLKTLGQFIRRLMKEKEQILIEYSDRENLLKAENEKLANKLKVYEAFGDKVMESPTINSVEENLKVIITGLNLEITDLRQAIESLKNATKKEAAQKVPKNPVGSRVLKVKEGESFGMIVFDPDYMAEAVRHLVRDFRSQGTQTAVSPAYLLFMMIRFMDVTRNGEALSNLIRKIEDSALWVVRRESKTEIQATSLWLANLHCLLNLMKQYSGSFAFPGFDSVQHQDKCLKFYDLTNLWAEIKGLLVYFYKKICQKFYEALENYDIYTTCGSERQFDGRNSCVFSTLLPSLERLVEILINHQVNQDVVFYILRQTYFSLTANAFNILLSRKDLLNWSIGSQITTNLGYMLHWAQETFSLDETKIAKLELAVKPLQEAGTLLQAKKTNPMEVESVLNLCGNLTRAQIVTMLTMFTPKENFEDRVSPAFISSATDFLESRQSMPGKSQLQLLLDPNYPLAMDFPFVVSDVDLQDVKIPNELKRLEKIAKII